MLSHISYLVAYFTLMAMTASGSGSLQDHYAAEAEQLLEFRMELEQNKHFHNDYLSTSKDVTGNVNGKGNRPSALQILEIVAKIFAKLSSGWINSYVPLHNYFLIEHLYATNVGTKGTIDPEEVMLVRTSLLKCLKLVQPLNLTSLKCSDKHAKSTPTKLAEGRGYTPSENDMIVELAWKGVDVVYSSCFPHFIDVNVHYLYWMEMEGFFKNAAVQKRWFRKITPGEREAYPIVLPGLKEETLKMADDVVNLAYQGSRNLFRNDIKKPRISV